MALVEGRLIDSRDGKPIPGAFVLGMQSPRTDDEAVRAARARRSEDLAEAIEHGWSYAEQTVQGEHTPQAFTTDRGRFVLRLWVGTSTLWARSGRILRECGTKPRSGLDTLYVEIRGRPAVRVPVPRGTWTWLESHASYAPGAHWDLGDVVVPAPERR